MFQGTSNLTIDAKGRLSMPTRYRDALVAQCEGRLTLTRHPDGCLLIYPRPIWEGKRAQLVLLNASARDLQRLLLGSASDVEFDGAGRIQISAELREDAGIARDVKLLGMGAHFELWDVERKKVHDDVHQAQLMAGAAADFTF